MARKTKDSIQTGINDLQNHIKSYQINTGFIWSQTFDHKQFVVREEWDNPSNTSVVVDWKKADSNKVVNTWK